MTTDADEVLRAAMRLSRDQRAELAALLIDSIEDGAPDEIETSWLEEAKRRHAQWRAGRASTVSGDEVREKLEMMLERGRSRSSAS